MLAWFDLPFDVQQQRLNIFPKGAATFLAGAEESFLPKCR